MTNYRNFVKRLVPHKLFRAAEPYGHLAEAVLANARFGFPSRKMHIIGVTGTNGKTTTSLLIQKMLYEAGHKTAVLSTVAYGVDGDIKPQLSHVTTAPAGILQKQLSEFKATGVEWVVLEVSSHSLAQYRVWGIPFEIVVLTNITHDHLDYHGTIDRYAEAKRRLFKIVSHHGRRLGIVNADDPRAEKFAAATPRSITYGINKGQLRAKDIKLTKDYCAYTAQIGDEKYDIRINIPGDFNVSNSLAAVAVGREVGLSRKQIERGIAALKEVEGRMTVIDKGQKFQAMVDFASSPDAFERVFDNLKSIVKGKLVVVFGSAGRRDETKRFKQGEIAGKNAAEVIITEEDDRDEDGNKIMAQIAEGAKKAGKKEGKDLHLILNREEAIGFALTRVSEPGDIVIALGKGHERTIERRDGVYAWSDIEVMSSALSQLVKNQKKKNK